ncbi:hypothetical protein [Sphaerimonospora mesophila]|uniref:hypothetical protein n=1 Tax=Sphaerimonospora mesophila TaxID=37483 RepID=UPI0006E1DD85
MPYLEQRVGTLESDMHEIRCDVTEIKDRLGVVERSVGSIERNTAIMRDDIAELKAGQIEMRDLLSRVVARLEGVRV